MRSTDIEQATNSIRYLRKNNSIRSIAEISSIDRTAPGWLTILLFGVVRSAWTVFIFIACLLPYLFYAQCLQRFYQALAGSPPEVFASFQDFPAQRLEAIRFYPLVVVLPLIALILFSSAGVRKAMAIDVLWPGTSTSNLPKVYRYILNILAGFSKALMISFLAFCLFWSLLPLYIFSLEAFSLINGWSIRGIQPFSSLLADWRIGTGAAALVGILVLFFRRRSRGTIVRTIVACSWIIGLPLLVWWIWPFLYGFTTPTIIFLTLMLVYPLGIAIPISRIFKLPFLSLRDTFYWLLIRIRLRFLLLAAYFSHWRRNTRQTKHAPWDTVCCQHNLRFHIFRVRTAYGQQFSYAACPECKDDQYVFNGIEAIVLNFDPGQKEPAVQRGPILSVNGNAWLSQPEMAPSIDGVNFGSADKHTLDLFFIKYDELAGKKDFRPVRQVIAAITTNGSENCGREVMVESIIGCVIRNQDLISQLGPLLHRWRRESLGRWLRNTGTVLLGWLFSTTLYIFLFISMVVFVFYFLNGPINLIRNGLGLP